MKIGVVTEVSTVGKNKDILAALDGFGFKVFNLGMKNEPNEPELTIVETGFLSALLLNLKCVDLVVGGCGTGQGYLNCVLQYPGVVCGLVLDPTDAWLFPQINGGNCISLALNKGFGWAGDVTLKFIFEKLFSVEPGGGYPEHRVVSQQKIRAKLKRVSQLVHPSFDEIIEKMDEEVLRGVLTFPGIFKFLSDNFKSKSSIENALSRQQKRFGI
jgi:ribose 5-phosphate isomerase RpiB